MESRLGFMRGWGLCLSCNLGIQLKVAIFFVHRNGIVKLTYCVDNTFAAAVDHTQASFKA